jgi:hypothetical protein
MLLFHYLSCLHAACAHNLYDLMFGPMGYAVIVVRESPWAQRVIFVKARGRTLVLYGTHHNNKNNNIMISAHVPYHYCACSGYLQVQSYPWHQVQARLELWYVLL